MNDKNRALSGAILGHFTNDGTLLLFTILIIYYVKLPNISLVYLGVIAVIYQILSGLFSTVVGKYSDKKVYYYDLISLGIVIEGIAVLLFGLAFYFSGYAYYFIFTAAIILGLGQAFYHPLSGTLLSDVFKVKAPKYMGITGIFGSVGRSIVPSLVAALILLVGGFYGLGIMALIYYFIAAFILFLFWGIRINRNPKKIYSLDKNSKLIESNDINQDAINKDKSIVRPFSYYKKSVYSLTFVTFLKSAFLMGIITFIGVYVKDVTHMPNLEVGAFLTVTFFFAVFGQYLFGWLVTKIGSRSALIYSMVLSVIGFGIFILTKNLILMYASYSLFTLTGLASFPILMSYSSDIVNRVYNNYSNSLVWGVGTIIGGAFGVGIITLIIDFQISVLNAMYVAEIIGIISLISILILPKTKK